MWVSKKIPVNREGWHSCERKGIPQNFRVLKKILVKRGIYPRNLGCKKIHPRTKGADSKGAGIKIKKDPREQRGAGSKLTGTKKDTREEREEHPKKTRVLKKTPEKI